MAADRKADPRSEAADLHFENTVLRDEMRSSGRYLSVVGGTLARLLEPEHRPLALAVMRTGQSLERKGAPDAAA